MLAVYNEDEDGGWEETNYILKPNKPMIEEFSEWQAEENAEDEYDEDNDEDKNHLQRKEKG